jgi:hypothetical protein
VSGPPTALDAFGDTAFSTETAHVRLPLPVFPIDSVRLRVASGATAQVSAGGDAVMFGGGTPTTAMSYGFSFKSLLATSMSKLKAPAEVGVIETLRLPEVPTAMVSGIVVLTRKLLQFERLAAVTPVTDSDD